MKTRIIILFSAFCLLFSLCGCEAFRKKFVRKPKKEKEIRTVTQIKEYKALYSPEVGYKQYYLFWRTSHEELLGSLQAQDRNRKRTIYSANKTVEHLRQMHDLLLPEKQKELGPFIAKQEALARRLDRRRLNRAQRLEIKSILKKQKKGIEHKFAFKHIQKYLIKE